MDDLGLFDVPSYKQWTFDFLAHSHKNTLDSSADEKLVDCVK